MAEVETALALQCGRRLVEERYGVGATSFLDVLDARRRTLVVESDFVRAETALLLDLTALNRALGRSG